MARVLETKRPRLSVLPVFLPGSYHPTTISVDTSRSASSPPRPLLIFTPSEQGTYPVILFFHGYFLRNSFYSDLLHHISSHGYIVVAPQFWDVMPLSGPRELGDAAKVADWLHSGGLKSVLPLNVKGDLAKLALVGHSRGGKTAFTLALGHAETNQPFAALVGVDPVAGAGRGNQLRPPILTYVPDSFDLSIPIAVIGTGLGPQSKRRVPHKPCAPDGVNHEDFFNESKAPAAHFVTTDYGHMDLLDDDPSGIAGRMTGRMCVRGEGPKEPMRRSVGGIVVAFLDCYFRKEEDFFTIINKPSVAPIKLDPVHFKQ